jgi:PAS domain S-box-containing protein
MKDQERTKRQLIAENEELRRRVAALEGLESEGKRADQMLLESEERYRSFVQDFPGIAYRGRMDFVPVFFHGAVEAITGYSGEEFASGRRRWDQVIHPDDFAQLQESWEKTRSVPGYSTEREYRIVRKDGQIRWVREIIHNICNGFGKPAFVQGVLYDITGRKQAEENLRESEKRFRSLFQDSSVGAVVVSPHGEFLQVNRAWCEFLGYSEQELVGRTVLSVTHPDDRAISSKAIHQAAHSGPRIQRLEKRYLPKSGRVVWGEVSSNLIRDAEGKPDYFITQVMDITKRKRAEEALKKAHDELEERVKERTSELTAANEALRESEETFRTLVEMSPDAVVTGDLTGHVTFASRQALQMYGTGDVEELLDENPLDFFAPKDHQKFLSNLRRTLEEGVTRDVEYDFARKDGTRFVGEASAAAINDMAGKPKGFVAIFRDITQRKQAEEALRQVSERLSLATTAAHVGIWDLDIPNGKLVWDDSMFRLYGITPNDFGGAYEAWRASVHPEDLPRTNAETQMALSGEKEFDTEFRVVWPDKSVHWIKANALVQHDASGKAVRMLGTNWDITGRKLAQEALEREQQTLWHMLQASDHERQLIAYDIHDGLAQYLASAGMQFQVFDHLRDSKPEEAKKAYDAATQLVSQSHFEARRLISDVRPPVIDEIGLETAISHLVYEQRQRGGPEIHFDSNVQFRRLPAILENALYRIVQEALTNACKHSKSKKAKVTLAQEGQEVQLEVRDWGIGFDPESVGKGHFGLEGIRQRVRLLGGRLTIESSPKRGTLIRVEVPIVERKEGDLFP